MRTLDFLTAIWPTQGYYCLANPRSKDGRSWWEHKSFSSIAEACEIALSQGQQIDQYFAVLSMHEAYTIDQKKIDKAESEGRKITKFTGRSYRTHANMAWARSFFIDLDVGKADGYPTQAVAFVALKEFLKSTGLPRPWIVSSGVGLHIYWPFADDVPADVWRPYAIKLKRLCEWQKLRADPVRTADLASVLRVPGTKHLKDPDNPKKVFVERDGPVTAFASICETIDRATKLVPTGDIYTADMPESMKAAPVGLDKLKKACGLAAALIENPQDANEPKWYKLLGIVNFLENGRKVAHEISSSHSTYDPAWIDGKLDQLSRTLPGTNTTLGPTTCNAFAETCGGEQCKVCWFARTSYYKDGASSPLIAARRLPIESAVGIPETPAPYMRTTGGVLKDGEVPAVVCPWDFYPVHLIDDPENRKRASVWIMVIPRRGPVEFTIPNSVANDLGQLGEFLADNAILANHNEVKEIRGYMSAYIRSLQQHMDDHQQRPHLGWTADRKTFVIGSGEVTGGKIKPTLLSNMANEVGSTMKQQGTMKRQIELLDFYNKPAYLGHQFMIGASLAAPLFFATGHYGTVVNMTSPHTGTSKSTALYTGAGFWGDPTSYTFSGLEDASTITTRNQKIAVLCNLPVCVDEITLLPPDVVKSMILGFSQKQAEKDRMTQKVQIRKKISDGKSTLMLTTSNNSLHELLAHRNIAGQAGSARVFEIIAALPEGAAGPEGKRLADRYLHDIKQHFGWIGPEWMCWVSRHLDEVIAGIQSEVSRLDEIGSMGAAERFWSAVAAVTIFTMKRAHAEGLMPYDAAAIEDWLLNRQLGFMRTVVSGSHSNALDTFLAYVASSANQMALLGRGNSGKVYLEKGPSGELAGGLQTDASRATIYLSHFKAYAARERIQINGLLVELEKSGVVKRKRVDPCAGTIFSTGAQPCIEVDLGHVLISQHEKAGEMSNVVNMRRQQ